MRPSVTACLAFCIGCCIAFPTALQFLQIDPKGHVTVSKVKHEVNKQVETKRRPKSPGHHHHVPNQLLASTPSLMPTPMPTTMPTPTPVPNNDAQVVTGSDLGLMRKAEPLLVPVLATDTKPVPDPSPVLSAPSSTPTPTPSLPPSNPPAHHEDPPKNQDKADGNKGGHSQADTQEYLELTIENGGSENLWPVAIQLSVNGNNGLSLSRNVQDDKMFGSEDPLLPGSSTIFKIPYGVMQVQVIPRFGCETVNGKFTCKHGDCGGARCPEGFVQTQDPVTRFELGWCDPKNKYVAGSIAYDISNIDVQPSGRVGVSVQGGPGDNCPTKSCSREGCGVSDAWLSASDVGIGSPADTVCKTKSLRVRFD
ncbi:hypothetical protein BCR37DRAFT_153169 [Protomyces lactucae-debilis]|uniref:Thaumatin family-domain-containing protein n=1 Tax=Protomyces lactucae-debilis TaxID=2754530 RepID=A0A1Y2F0C8_PROLT|nr:uncharacterized protein BCR37DRAFT_153169 [Protomyces lactucae-debilis]ORY77338.1 hypothetical protein BCR37DRAFT_153169 [Protomyces lactucae-debilis]